VYIEGKVIRKETGDSCPFMFTFNIKESPLTYGFDLSPLNAKQIGGIYSDYKDDSDFSPASGEKLKNMMRLKIEEGLRIRNYQLMAEERAKAKANKKKNKDIAETPLSNNENKVETIASSSSNNIDKDDTKGVSYLNFTDSCDSPKV